MTADLPLTVARKMTISTLLEVFGHILQSFTRGVTEQYNPGYSPLESTGREWYCHPVDELIYQEYSDREATSLDYQVSRCVQVKVTDASSIENNEETHIASHEHREMAWKQLRPSVIRTICKSMYIGASISLFTAGIVGAIYILISFICYKTVHNCEFSLKKEIPLQVQWMRTISASILCAFLYIWYFTNALFLFRSFQLMDVKRKLILISVVFVLFGCSLSCITSVFWRIRVKAFCFTKDSTQRTFYY